MCFLLLLAYDAEESWWKLHFRVLVADTDDDNYRPSKRSRADFRPPAVARSYDDADAMLSSPGRSQRGHSREDVPMTDQTDDDPYEVSCYLQLWILLPCTIYSPFRIVDLHLAYIFLTDGFLYAGR